MSGAETFNQPVGTLNNFTFAAAHTSVGYSFTDPKAFFACCEYAGLVSFGARGVAGANWSSDALTRHRFPVLDPRLSWSPDDRYIAFATGANYVIAGVSYEVSPATPTAMGLAVYARGQDRVFEVEPQTDSSMSVAGWIARQ